MGNVQDTITDEMDIIWTKSPLQPDVDIFIPAVSQEKKDLQNNWMTI
jgi:hypothetical protein